MNTYHRITLAIGFMVVAGFGTYVPWDMEIARPLDIGGVQVTERQQG